MLALASAVSNAITACASAAAASGASPASSNIFWTCATYLARVSLDFGSSLR